MIATHLMNFGRSEDRWGVGLPSTAAMCCGLLLGVLAFGARPGRAEVPPPRLPLDPAKLGTFFDLDFRGSRYDHQALRIEGSGIAVSLIKPQAEGLAVSAPRGTEVPGINLCTKFGIRGDCQVIAAYEILYMPRPKSGPGVGLEVNLQSATDGDKSVKLSRHVDQATGHATFSCEIGGIVSPTRSVSGLPGMSVKEGCFYLARSGPTVYLYAAEGGGEFRKIGEGDFGTSDVKFMRLSVTSPGTAQGFGIRWKNLTVRAESLPRMPEGPPGSTFRSGLVAAGLFVVLAAAAIIWIYVYRKVWRAWPS